MTGHHRPPAAQPDPFAWHAHALCRGLADLFDPPDPTPETEAWAKDICSICPVLTPCHRWVMSLPTRYDPGGVTAQRTEDERRHVRHAASVRRGQLREAS